MLDRLTKTTSLIGRQRSSSPSEEETVCKRPRWPDESGDGPLCPNHVNRNNFTHEHTISKMYPSKTTKHLSMICVFS